MVGRFLLQKFFSGMSRSTSLLGNQGSARARTTAPTARYFNTFTCSHAGTRTSWPPREIPLINIYYGKPFFADCVRGARQTFSSSATNKQASSRAKMHSEEYTGAAWNRIRSCKYTCKYIKGKDSDF